MTFEQAQAADLVAIVDIWNLCLGDTHPLRAELLEQQWQNTHHEPKLIMVAKQQGAIVGVIAGKANTASWADQSVGHLSYVAVHPDYRRQGIGTNLYQRLADQLTVRERRKLRVGGDVAHLLPGIPTEVGTETWRFFRQRGLLPLGAEHDLRLDLSLSLPEVPLARNLRVEPASNGAVLDFLARTFPGRWHFEMEQALKAGTTVLSLLRGNEVLGFAAVFLPKAGFIGPSQFWSPALSGKVAGLGPMGISPELRGQGQGLALFTAASHWLQERGAEHLLIDWTMLTGFYGRAGAHIWRTYQRVGGLL